MVTWLRTLCAAVCASLALVTFPSATAAAEMCRGLPATIVGPENSEVLGTLGDDVIVAPYAAQGSVEAGAGDDVICIVDGDPPGGPAGRVPLLCSRWGRR